MTAAPRLSRGITGAIASATTVAVPLVDHVVHLDFGHGGVEVTEVENTLPGDLYDALFNR